MIESQIISPGTVSKILWHFTGGPTWNIRLKKQNRNPKPKKEAYENLINILKEQKLRLGDYREIVSISNPIIETYDSKTRTKVIERDVKIDLESHPICCVADIPIMHLNYLTPRYGKFALGFYRNSLIKKGFNPVLYSLYDTNVIKTIYKGLSQLELIELEDIKWAVDSIREVLDDQDDIDGKDEIENITVDIETESTFIENYKKTALNSFKNLLAFIKTFNKDEFSTIYCEREWRSISDFNFTVDDIAMVVIPKNIRGENYFIDFLENKLERVSVPSKIPIIPWEDLIEH